MRGRWWARGAAVADGVLTAALVVWGTVPVLPVAAWTGVTDRAYYATTWGLWWHALLVALLVTALALVVSRGAIAGLARRSAAATLAAPRVPFVAVLAVLAGLEAVAIAVWCF